MFKNLLHKIILKRSTGEIGEDTACKYLRKKGYSILERNLVTPYGEIDIVAMKDNILVFVEVKKRTTEQFGKGYVSVVRAKQKKIINSSQHYCQTKKINCLCRFDVVSIDGKGKEIITHIENAFLA